MARLVGALMIAVMAFTAYGLAVDSPFVWIYVPITVVLAVAVFFIHRSVALSAASLWALVAVAVGNLAGGIYLVDGQPLYVKRLVGDVRYDKPFHTVATAVAAWAAYEVVAKWAHGRASRPAIAVASVLIAAGIGALVEIIEFVGSVVIENANVGGYGDTMLDLVVNTAGATAAVILQDRRVGGGCDDGGRSHQRNEVERPGRRFLRPAGPEVEGFVLLFEHAIQPGSPLRACKPAPFSATTARAVCLASPAGRTDRAASRAFSG